jgi:hypothetical protein
MSTVTIPTAEAASISTGLNLPDRPTPDESVEAILAAIRVMTPDSEDYSEDDLFALAGLAQEAVAGSTGLPTFEDVSTIFDNVDREVEDNGAAEAKSLVDGFREKVEAEFGPTVEVTVLDGEKAREVIQEARAAVAEFDAMMGSLMAALFGEPGEVPEGEDGDPFQSVGLLSIDGEGRVEKIA